MPDEVDEGKVEDADADQPDAPDWDLTPVAKFLTARSKTEAEAAWVDALPAISEGFPPDVWGCTEDVNTYGPGAHANLYNTEIRSDFKTWLSDQGVSLDDYAAAVGPVQYASAQIFLGSLFKRARNNRGWRLRILGFPRSTSSRAASRVTIREPRTTTRWVRLPPASAPARWKCSMARPGLL